MTVVNGYASNAEVKAICQITGSSDDIIIDLAINAASRMIDGYCGWRFWQDDALVVRTFEVHCHDVLYLLDDPSGDGISTATGVVVKLDEDGDGTFERTLTVGTDYVLEPLNAAARWPVWPYTVIAMTDTYALPRHANRRAGVQVTAKWGWPAVPDDVESACVLIARDLYKEMKSAPFGVADFNAEGPLRIGQNRTARTLLDRYRKPAVG